MRIEQDCWRARAVVARYRDQCFHFWRRPQSALLTSVPDIASDHTLQNMFTSHLKTQLHVSGNGIEPRLAIQCMPIPM